MFSQCLLQRDPFVGVFPDPKITSSIEVAEKKSNRFGGEFFVVKRQGDVSVLTEYELNRQKSVIENVIYSTATGFQFNPV